MSNRIAWGFDPTAGITSFVLTKSTDGGLEYDALATIPFNVSGANFDRATRTFFYIDAAGNPGDTYKIVAVGPLGSSEPSYIVAPPGTPAKCLVVGYALNGFGEADTKLAVHIETYGARGNWGYSPSGVVGQNPMALGVLQSSKIAYSDENGMWQVDLLQRTYARITIAKLSLDWAFEVPDREGPVNIRDIPLIRQADFFSQFPNQQGVKPRIPG